MVHPGHPAALQVTIHLHVKAGPVNTLICKDVALSATAPALLLPFVDRVHICNPVSDTQFMLCIFFTYTLQIRYVILQSFSIKLNLIYLTD